MRHGCAIAALLVAAACGDASAGDDFVDPFMDEPLPPECRDTSSTGCGGSSESGDASSCSASAPCPAGQVCAASFDGDIGTFHCEASCIATDDEARWCLDATACCAAEASCVRGLCLSPAATTSG